MPMAASALALAALPLSDCAAFFAASDIESWAAAARGSSRANGTSARSVMGVLLSLGLELAHGAAGAARDQQVGRAPREQAHRHDAGELVEVGLEADRIG